MGESEVVANKPAPRAAETDALVPHLFYDPGHLIIRLFLGRFDLMLADDGGHPLLQ